MSQTFILSSCLFVCILSLCSSTTCCCIVCPDSAWWAPNSQFEPELALTGWKWWRLTMKNTHTLSRCLGKKERWSCRPGESLPTTAANLGISRKRPRGPRCCCHLFSQRMLQTSGNLTSCRRKSGFTETGTTSFLWSLYCLGQRCVYGSHQSGDCRAARQGTAAI